MEMWWNKRIRRKVAEPTRNAQKMESVRKHSRVLLARARPDDTHLDSDTHHTLTINRLNEQAFAGSDFTVF